MLIQRHVLNTPCHLAVWPVQFLPGSDLQFQSHRGVGRIQWDDAVKGTGNVWWRAHYFLPVRKQIQLVSRSYSIYKLLPFLRILPFFFLFYTSGKTKGVIFSDGIMKSSGNRYCREGDKNVPASTQYGVTPPGATPRIPFQSTPWTAC